MLLLVQASLNHRFCSFRKLICCLLSKLVLLQQEEEETDELLLLDEEMLDAHPEDLPRRLLTNFAIYNAEVPPALFCSCTVWSLSLSPTTTWLG